MPSPTRVKGPVAGERHATPAIIELRGEAWSASGVAWLPHWHTHTLARAAGRSEVHWVRTRSGSPQRAPGVQSAGPQGGPQDHTVVSVQRKPPARSDWVRKPFVHVLSHSTHFTPQALADAIKLTPPRPAPTPPRRGRARGNTRGRAPPGGGDEGRTSGASAPRGAPRGRGRYKLRVSCGTMCKWGAVRRGGEGGGGGEEVDGGGGEGRRAGARAPTPHPSPPHTAPLPAPPPLCSDRDSPARAAPTAPPPRRLGRAGGGG